MVQDTATPARAVPETEAELEVFRQRWREEVSARSHRPTEASNGNIREERFTQTAVLAGPAASRYKEGIDYSDDFEPRAYHDLPNKEDQLKLGVDGQSHDRDGPKEPETALEHYERAVEKETLGQLGESMRHYRLAFRLDDGVHEAYKRKHFPPSAFSKPKPTNPNPSNASVTVPNTAHHSLHGSKTGNSATDSLPPTLKQMVEDFSALRILPPEPPTDASPPEHSPIAELPEEILIHILTLLADLDVAAFARLSSVCKRLAYLILTEESIWKTILLSPHHGFPSQHYTFTTTLTGAPLDRILNPSSHPHATPNDHLNLLSSLLPTYASSPRQMFRSRPRIRFNGCYISTVNYTRAGGAAANSLTWATGPVHVVTYFRYLRFYRDGTAISLLTTTEPADVVHVLGKRWLGVGSAGIGGVGGVMKDALRGRWRLTGPLKGVVERREREMRRIEGSEEVVDGLGEEGEEEDEEVEGDLIVETQGVIPAKYTYVMRLAVAHAGKTARNNKLAWKGFWSYNKLTDDWGEFSLRNDKAFYWSRVRSYEKEDDSGLV